MGIQAVPKTKRGLARRAKILEAAEAVIGAHGFAAASIAEITQQAGTALGTFYIYFSGKEEVFRELILEMGRLTRIAVSNAVSGSPDRLTAERLGLEAFLRFLMARPSLYRIVEEARFTDPEAYRSYFTAFGDAYATGLRDAQKKGEISAGDPEIRAWALMGMARALGDRYILWDDAPDIEYVVKEAHSLICHGLEP